MDVLRCIGVAVALFATVAHAGEFPERPVKNIVPLSTGSASDAVTRIVARSLSEIWKVPVIVENKPGANGIPATVDLVRSAPDGYTLLTVATNHVINASLIDKLPYDTLSDVSPIARIAFTPLILCVSPTLQVKTFSDLVALAKSKPGSLTYGSAGIGSTTHLAGEMLKNMAGIDLLHVPYKAISQAQTDLAASDIDMMFVVPSVAIPQIKAGRYRAIAIGGPNRLPDVPEIPTLNESGLVGFDATPWIGLVGPAGLPDAITKKVSDDVLKVLALPEVQGNIVANGFAVAGMPSEQFGKFMRSEQARWAEVVKKSGARNSQ